MQEVPSEVSNVSPSNRKTEAKMPLEERAASAVEDNLVQREFAHHDAILQSYRQMFLVSEIFMVTITATRLADAGIVGIFAIFGLGLIPIWLLVTITRAAVVSKFECSSTLLSDYHSKFEGTAHRAAFLIFTGVFPALFVVMWTILVLLAHHII